MMIWILRQDMQQYVNKQHISLKKFVLATNDLVDRYDTTSCMNMANQRIRDEMTYVQTLMVRKTNTLMKDVWQTYTQISS